MVNCLTFLSSLKIGVLQFKDLRFGARALVFSFLLRFSLSLSLCDFEGISAIITCNSRRRDKVHCRSYGHKLLVSTSGTIVTLRSSWKVP
ncbi:hypothetical protein Ancab_025745 [Ancistrocladus abbreviatus]